MNNPRLPSSLQELADQATRLTVPADADAHHWIWSHKPVTRLSADDESISDLIFVWDDGRIRHRVAESVYRVTPGPRPETYQTQDGGSAIQAVHDKFGGDVPDWIALSITRWWPPRPDVPPQVELECFRVVGAPERPPESVVAAPKRAQPTATAGPLSRGLRRLWGGK